LIGACRGVLGIDDSVALLTDGGAGDGASSTDASGAVEGGALADGAVAGDGSSASDGATGDSSAGGDAGEGGTTSTVDARYANWPMAPDHPTQLTTSASGTIVNDALTGLSWEQTSTSMYSSITMGSAYCAGLTLGGKNDWRVPTRIELLSIVDYDPTMAPAKLPAIFGAHNSNNWTQSKIIGNAACTYSIGFLNSAEYDLVFPETVGASAWTRCVRGGAPLPNNWSDPPPAGLFVVQGSYVQDTRTGLLWERDVTAPADTYGNAVNRCTALGTGFRVPTERESHTLTDESRTAAPVWPAVFSGSAGTYWTSTVIDNSHEWTWTSGGTADVDDPQVASHFVRCVKSM
jgi:hypothetical protein